jgi:hypothetical protein
LSFRGGKFPGFQPFYSVRFADPVFNGNDGSAQVNGDKYQSDDTQSFFKFAHC